MIGKEGFLIGTEGLLIDTEGALAGEIYSWRINSAESAAYASPVPR